MSPLVRLADLKATCRSFHIRYLKEVIFFSPIIQTPILELYTTLPMVKFRARPPVIQLKNNECLSGAFEIL